MYIYIYIILKVLNGLLANLPSTRYILITLIYYHCCYYLYFPKSMALARKAVNCYNLFIYNIFYNL